MNKPLEFSNISSSEEELALLNKRIQACGSWDESIRGFKHVVGLSAISLILATQPVPRLNTEQIVPKTYDEAAINLLDKSLNVKAAFEKDMWMLEEQIAINGDLEDEEAQSEQRILNSYMNIMNDFYNSSDKEFIL